MKVGWARTKCWPPSGDRNPLIAGPELGKLACGKRAAGVGSEESKRRGNAIRLGGFGRYEREIKEVTPAAAEGPELAVGRGGRLIRIVNGHRAGRSAN